MRFTTRAKKGFLTVSFDTRVEDTRKAAFPVTGYRRGACHGRCPTDEHFLKNESILFVKTMSGVNIYLVRVYCRLVL